MPKRHYGVFNWFGSATPQLNKFERIQNMSYREDELEDAIDRYVAALDSQGLVDYVTEDLNSSYQVADDEIIDMFIAQMNGE